MATTLTSPVDLGSVTHQGITSIQFKIPHKRSVDGTQAIVNRDRVVVAYQVTTWDGNGKVIATASRTVAFANWPNAFKTDARGVYAKLELDAKNNGLIGAGTGEDL